MNNIYHILNGDALKEQFPLDIFGEKIIARLCLVDGPVDGETEDDLFAVRAAFINEKYPGFSKADYQNNIDLQIGKISSIPENATINL